MAQYSCRVRCDVGIVKVVKVYGRAGRQTKGNNLEAGVHATDFHGDDSGPSRES